MSPDRQHHSDAASTQELLDAARRHLMELSSRVDALGDRGLSDDEIAAELGMSINEASQVSSRQNAAWFARLEGQGSEPAAEQLVLVGLRQLRDVVATLAGDSATGEAFSRDLADLVGRHIQDRSLASAIKHSLGH